MKLFSKITGTALWIIIFITILIKKDYIINYGSNLKFEEEYLILMIIICHILFSILILPCGAISILYGMLLGINYGLAISLTVSLFSTCLTFYFAKNNISPIKFYDLNKFENYLQKKIYTRENTVILFSYINPLLPGSSLGYIFGSMKIKFINFLLMSFLGLVPLNLIMVIIGNYFK